MPPIVLPNAPYAPDLPGFPAQGAANAHNVYPRSTVSWGAIPEPQSVSTALAAHCQGMASFLGSDGAAHIYAGDAGHLYLITGAGYTWVDISKVGGYGASDNTLWEFVYFNDQIIATDYNDPLQSQSVGSGSDFDDLAAAAPQGRHIAVIKNAFVMVGNTNDPANGVMPQRVWWCAAGDASNWPTPGSQVAAEFQAGAADMLGEHGPITALRSDLTSADGLLFQQDSLKRIVYTGPPSTFDFLPAQNSRGTYSPYSPVVVGGICYFLGYDGFYSCDGASVTAIGSDRINRAFLDDLSPANYTRVIGASDPLRQVVWWAYAGQGSAHGELNRIIGYSWLFDRWCLLDVPCEILGKVFTTGYGLDDLWTILGYTLDTLPAPLDSPLWQGGAQIMAIFDTDHKLSFFTGMSLSPLVETQEMELFPGQRALTTGVRPLIDGTNVQIPQVAIKHREIAEATPIITPYIGLNSLGKAPVRTSGRYIRASITVPAGGDWTNISGAEVDAIPQGQR